MSDVNVITLTGNAGGEAEWKEVGDTDLAIVNLAVNMYAGKDREEETMWIRLNFWGARSKVAEYIKSGMPLTIQGKLRHRRVENDDGEVKWYTSVDVDDVKLPPKGDSGGGGGGNGGRSRSRGQGTGNGRSTRGGSRTSRGRGRSRGEDRPNKGKEPPF